LPANKTFSGHRRPGKPDTGVLANVLWRFARTLFFARAGHRFFSEHEDKHP